MTPLFLGRLILVLLINKIFVILITQNTEIVECGPTQAKQKTGRVLTFCTHPILKEDKKIVPFAALG